MGLYHSLKYKNSNHGCSHANLQSDILLDPTYAWSYIHMANPILLHGGCVPSCHYQNKWAKWLKNLSVSLSLSLVLSLSLFVSVSLFVSLSLFFSLFLCLSVYLSLLSSLLPSQYQHSFTEPLRMLETVEGRESRENASTLLFTPLQASLRP